VSVLLARRGILAKQTVGGGGGAGSVFVQDTFTGTTGDTLVGTPHVGETGATWSNHPSGDSGAWRITAAGILVAGSGNGRIYASGTPVTAEYDVEWDVIYQASPTGNFVCARMDTTADTFYQVRVETGAGLLELWKRVAGASTQLQAQSSGGMTVGQTKRVKLQVRDATKKVFHDVGAGYVEILSSTDNSITAAGRVGMRSTGNNVSDTAGTGFDNLVATNV
jgi:hypothetical protein